MKNCIMVYILVDEFFSLCDIQSLCFPLKFLPSRDLSFQTIAFNFLQYSSFIGIDMSLIKWAYAVIESLISDIWFLQILWILNKCHMVQELFLTHRFTLNDDFQLILFLLSCIYFCI